MILVVELARGLAALWVFFFHAKDLFGEKYPWLVSFANHGHLGVPMFFVISGYVIFHSATKNRSEGLPAEHFLRNRLRRIYPAFWSSVVVVMTIPYMLSLVSSLKTGNLEPVLLPGSAFSVAEWLHFLLLSKVFFAQNGDLAAQFTAVNAVYWTLAIEVQFYLVMYLCLRAGRFFSVGLWAITALAAIDFALGGIGNPGWFYHFWLSFAAGLALGWCCKKALEFPTAWPAHFSRLPTAVGLLFGVVACVAVVHLKLGPLAFSCAFAVMLWLAASVEPFLMRQRMAKGRTWSKWFLEGGLALGAMSYSVYLLHGKLYLLTGMFIRQLVPIATLAYGVGTIVFTLLLCWPFYKAIEWPFMSKTHQTKFSN